jgi:hypothetical protein
MFQHCPQYPCNCLRCQTGIDMGLVRLVREREMAKRYSTKEGRRASNCIVDDCSTVLENDLRYPRALAIALDRLRRAAGFDFR